MKHTQAQGWEAKGEKAQDEARTSPKAKKDKATKRSRHFCRYKNTYIEVKDFPDAHESWEIDFRQSGVALGAKGTVTESFVFG